MLQLLGGIVVTVLTVYCPPRGRTGRGRGKEGGGLYPELACLGISEGFSPNVQEEIGRLTALLPIAQANAELSRRGLELDHKTVHRVSVGLGNQMLATRTRDLQAFRAGTLAAGSTYAGKRIAVAIDGGRVRTRTLVRKSRVGKTRKRRKFRVEWREPKLLVVFELDENGQMERKRPTTTVLDGTLQGPDALMELVAMHLHRLGAAQATHVVFLGDGAAWIWARLDWVIAKVGLEASRVTQVLDWCHAVHHLGLAVATLGIDPSQRIKCYRRLRAALKRGQWEEVVEELEEARSTICLKRKELRREVAYLRKHGQAKRLNYGIYRYRRLPVGSGAIESAVRRVINLRLKGTSIYWKADHAEAVLQLRCALLSGRWDEVIARTRCAMRRDRRTDWHWRPVNELAELKALAADSDELPQRPVHKRAAAMAA